MEMINDAHSVPRRTVLLGSLLALPLAALPHLSAAAMPLPDRTASARRPASAQAGHHAGGLRTYGVTYDTGFYGAGLNVGSTHEPFDLKRVERDMRALKTELRASAVRITGGNPARIDQAARLAHRFGLAVWYAPFTCDLSQEQTIATIVASARDAERLRQEGGDVTFVAGAELSLFTEGFIPGANGTERTHFLMNPGPDYGAVLSAIPAKLNTFFATALPQVRAVFGGRVTYASISGLERIDWSPFDILSADIYRSAAIAATFTDSMRAFVAQGAALGKPVAATELGCATYDGAAAGGAQEFVEYDAATNTAIRLTKPLERDEAEQAQTIEELLTIFDETGFESAFVCVMVARHLPYRPTGDPLRDVDRSSFGITRPLETGRRGWRGHDWEPKLAFDRVGSVFARFRRR